MAGILNFSDLSGAAAGDNALRTAVQSAYYGQLADNETLKNIGLNALRDKYGDVAANPQAFSNLMSGLQTQALTPGEVQAQSDLSALRQAQTTRDVQSLPYDLAEKKAVIGNTQATAEKTDIYNTQMHTAMAASSALFGLKRAQVAIASGADPAQVFTSLGPQAAQAFGIPPEKMAQLGAAIKQHPELMQELTDRLQQLARPLMLGTLTPEAQSFLAARVAAGDTSALSGLGYGKQGAFNRASVINQAAAGGATAQGTITGKNEIASQKAYLADLAKSSPTTAGGMARSAGAVLAHMDLMEQYIDALGNGDVKALNALTQRFKAETGSVPPAQFDAQKRIVSDELTRYLIARGGTKADREGMMADIARANSPQQLRGVIETWKTDIVGQLAAQRQQAQGFHAEKQFDAVLTPRARELLSQHSGGSSGSAPQFKEGTVYVDRAGHKARYQGGKFVPVQ